MKDELKALGAMFDGHKRRWYVPPGRDVAVFAKFFVERTYLDCPYAQKDKARNLGAYWNEVQKQWFVPPGLDLEPFKEWIKESPDGVDVLPDAAAPNAIDLDAEQPPNANVIDLDAADANQAQASDKNDFTSWKCEGRWRCVYECPFAAAAKADDILGKQLEQARKEHEELRDRRKRSIREHHPQKKAEKINQIKAHLAWIEIREQALKEAETKLEEAKTVADKACGIAKDDAILAQVECEEKLAALRKFLKYGLTTFVDFKNAEKLALKDAETNLAEAQDKYAVANPVLQEEKEAAFQVQKECERKLEALQKYLKHGLTELNQCESSWESCPMIALVRLAYQKGHSAIEVDAAITAFEEKVSALAERRHDSSAALKQVSHHGVICRGANILCAAVRPSHSMEVTPHF